MSNVPIAPPNIKEADPRAVAVANYLRHHNLLKQRQCILNGKRSDFFRVKRAVRALEDPKYQKAQRKNKNLPEINKREDALEAFRLLPLNRLAFRVGKMETEEAKKAGLKPVRGIPVVQVVPQQEFGDDMYYTWFYEPVPMLTYVYAALAVIAIFGIILFPLWPVKLRVGVWYLSMGLIGFLCLFFVIAIIRLIVFIFTYFLVRPGLWIFPNLFEDVGFVDSFIPLYSWHGQKTLPSKKNKKNKKRNMGLSPGAAPLTAAGAAGAAGAAQGAHAHQHGGQGGPQAGPSGQAGAQGAQGGGPQFQAGPQGAGGPQGAAGMLPNPQALLQMKMQENMVKVQKRKQEIMSQPNAPSSPQEIQALERKLFAEEMMKTKQEFEQLKQKLQEQGLIPKNGAAGGGAGASVGGVPGTGMPGIQLSPQQLAAAMQARAQAAGGAASPAQGTPEGASSGAQKSNQTPTKRTVTLEDEE